VSEGEAAHLGWVMAPGSEGEGGEGFYIGSCPDLLVFLGGEGLALSWTELSFLEVAKLKQWSPAP
jgi:hypothetical protein